MSGVDAALAGIGGRHREQLLLLWSELSSLEVSERLAGNRGLPGPALALRQALYPFLAVYGPGAGSPAAGAGGGPPRPGESSPVALDGRGWE